jgi:hypothetical protein
MPTEHDHHKPMLCNFRTGPALEAKISILLKSSIHLADKWLPERADPQGELHWGSTCCFVLSKEKKTCCFLGSVTNYRLAFHPCCIQNQDHVQFGVHFIHINNILYHPLRTPENSDFRIKIQVSKYEYQIQCQYQQSCYPYEIQYTEKYQLFQWINPSIRAGPSWNDASTNMIE